MSVATERACPICAQTSPSRLFLDENVAFEQINSSTFASRKLPEHMHYRLMICRSCDILYANPVPEKSFLESAYQTADFDSEVESRAASRTYGRLAAQVVKRLGERDSALDIGASDGAFMAQLVALGFQHVHGVEPCAKAHAAAPRELKPKIRLGSFQAIDFNSESFNFVACCMTLEHVFEPAQLCRDIFKLLKPGGAALLVTHNRRALSAKVLGKKSPIFDIEHLQLFSTRGMQGMLSRLGFINISVTSFSNTYPLSYWTKLLPFSISIKRLVLRALETTRLGAIPVMFPAGNIVSIAFKPL